MIDQLQHPMALLIETLLSREGRRELGQILIDEEENILQAISAKIKISQLISTEPENIPASLKQALSPETQILGISLRTAKKLFGGEKVSRLFAIATQPEALPCSYLSKVEGDFIVLEKLSISGNIGAIIRSATAFKIGAMILLDSDPVDIYDRRVIRASRGYVFHLPLLSLNTAEFIQFCQDQKIKILAMTSHSENRIETILQKEPKLAILLGAEKDGCSDLLFQSADLKAKISMDSKVESLNVSVAAGIVSYLRNLNKEE